MHLNIGVDDTDSNTKFCTTYLGSKLVDLAREFDAKIDGFPKLIRLNPNIPYKTRGNAAVALKIKISKSNLDSFKKAVIEKVKELSDLDDENTNPGIVFLEEVPNCILQFSKKALRYRVEISDAEKLLKKANADYYKFKSGRGIIGALAAIGYRLDDCTYELIAYRKKQNWGKKRLVGASSVVEMNNKTYPDTFNNIDRETEKVLITPNTPCPISCGIRGECPDVVSEAFKMLDINEEIEGFQIFQTNQHTDDHIIEVDDPKEICDMTTIRVCLSVTNNPITIQGSHTFFSAKNDGTELEVCSFYPTGNLRKISQELISGDEIVVWGSVKKDQNNVKLNLEKMKIESCNPMTIQKNPVCPKCNKRSASAGKNQEYRCKECKISLGYLKEREKVPRNLVGFYEAPERSQRHLHKPIIRYKTY